MTILTPYQKRKMSLVKRANRIDEVEKTVANMMEDFKESMRAQSLGLQNVYDKFIELEQRQSQIEGLLESDRIKSMIKAIPNEETILKMFKMIDSHPISDIKEKIDEIREDLEELTDRFRI